MERPNSNSISKGRLKTCQESDHQGRPKHPPYPEATTVGGGSFPHWLCGKEEEEEEEEEEKEEEEEDDEGKGKGKTRCRHTAYSCR